MITPNVDSPPGFPDGSAGFVLPTALTLSAVLLLSSLSLQTLSLHARQRGYHPWRFAARSDAAQSAAMDFARRSQGAQVCLLHWPSQRWRDPQVCPQADPQLLQSGAVGDLHWSLERWQPNGASGRLQLSLAEIGSVSVVMTLHAAGAQVAQVTP